MSLLDGGNAAAVELSTRINNLSFRHHREVASIKPIVEQADGTLALGEERNSTEGQKRYPSR